MLAVLLIMMLSGCGVYPATGCAGCQDAAPSTVTRLEPRQATLRIQGHILTVVLAETPSELASGLTPYEEVPNGTGMLFVLPQDSQPTFWTKGMHFAIDIIWIDDGQVVQIDAEVPPVLPDTPDAKVPRYRPGQPVDHVLELAAGAAEELGIRVGDKVEILALGN